MAAVVRCVKHPEYTGADNPATLCYSCVLLYCFAHQHRADSHRFLGIQPRGTSPYDLIDDLKAALKGLEIANT